AAGGADSAAFLRAAVGRHAYSRLGPVGRCALNADSPLVPSLTAATLRGKRLPILSAPGGPRRMVTQWLPGRQRLARPRSAAPHSAGSLTFGSAIGLLGWVVQLAYSLATGCPVRSSS